MEDNKNDVTTEVTNETVEKNNSETTSEIKEEIKEEVKEEIKEEVEEAKTEETKIEDTKIEDTKIEESKIEESIIKEEVKTDSIINVPPSEPVKTPVATEPQKKSKFPIILVAIIAIVAVIAAVIGLNYKAINNSIKKATMSPEEYARYIISNNAHKTAEFYRTLYEKNLTNGIFSDNVDATTSLSFQITEEGFEFLDDMDVDVDDIEDAAIFKDKLSVSYTAKHAGEASFISLGFTSGKKSLGSAELIFDKANQMVYVRMPEFGKDYASIALEDFYTDEEIDDLYTIIDSLDQVGEVLISGEQLESIITRYQDIVIAQIDDVEVSKETLEVGDLKQKVTAIEIEIDGELAYDALIAIAEEFVNDEEIAGIIENISTIDYIEDADDFIESYEGFLDEMEDALDEMDEYMDEDDTSYTITLYVDNKGEVVGTKVEGESSFTYDHYDWEVDDYVKETVTTEVEFFGAYVISGSKFAFEAYAKEDGDTELSIKGDGKAKGTKLSGEFTVKADGEKVKFNIENLDFTKWSKGIIDAKITFDFDQFGKEIPKEVRDLSIAITLNGSKDTYSLSLENEGQLLMLAEVSTSISNKASISIPKKAVALEDGDDIEDYIDDLDFSSLEDLLDDLDVDDADDIIDELGEELAWYVENNLPIETLLVPEVGIPTNPIVPVIAGVTAPQLIKYIEQSRISTDIMFAETISSAVQEAYNNMDTDDYDSCYDTIDDLSWGVDITTWGKPSDPLQEEIADILGISDFSTLDKNIKSKYTGEGIWVTLYTYDGSTYVEFRNTARYTWASLDGYYNITASSY